MRILFFNYESPSLDGGAGDTSYYLLKEYAKNPNIVVDFITSSVDEKQHILKLGENITIYRLPIGKNPDDIHHQSKSALIEYVKEAYKFSKQLARENQYDLSHSFGTVPCGIVSLRLKKKCKIPYAISLCESDFTDPGKQFNFLHKFTMPSGKEILENAYFVVANSLWLREITLKSDSQKEVGVIYDGINIAEFHSDPSKRNNDQFTIICVSRIAPEKGIRILIQAFKIISGRYDYVRLFIVGDGEERSSLEHLAQGLELEKEVVFTGVVPYEKVLEYYQKSDLFVSPYLEKGISKVVLEAMACSLPVIAADSQSARDIFEDNLNILFAKKNDASDLAEKIEKLLLDRKLLENIAKNSRLRAEHFDWNEIAKEYINLYEKTKSLGRIRQGE